MAESSHEDWLHYNISYGEAVALLESVGKPDELFLVTNSKVEPNNYNLIFSYENNLNNFEISLTENGKFQMGNGTQHKSLEMLIDFHRKNKEALPCLLTKCLNKNGEIVTDLVSCKSKVTSQTENPNTKIRRRKSFKIDQIDEVQMKSNGLQWIPANYIEISQKIGEGEFGFVYKGTYTDKKKEMVSFI